MSGEGGDWREWVTDARNVLLLVILLFQMLTAASSWLFQRRTINDVLRILRQDFREQCVDSGHPVSQCEKRLRADDRYWPNEGIIYRSLDLPASDKALYALYRVDPDGD